MKKVTFFIIPFLSITLLGCNPSSTSEESSYLSYSDEVKNISLIGDVTGSDAITDTSEMTVGGCDLGYPMYDESREVMLNFYGDSFDTPVQSGRWRSNTVSKSTDFDLSDGMSIDSFISSPSGIAKPCIEGHHSDKYEMTKIPTGAIAIDGVYYMFYFSKYSWNVSSDHSMNYGGCIKSSDGGENWTRVYDLSWADHVVDNDKLDQGKVNDIQVLMNESVDLERDGGSVNLVHHEGYRFTEIYPYMGNDGYVYLFGMGGYRSSYISLARVKVNNFEVFDQYEYLIGYDDKTPKWLSGRSGLDYLSTHYEEGYCLESTGSEMSLCYNKTKKCYMLFMGSNSSRTYGATYFTSTNLYGPYNRHGSLVLPASSELLPINSIYAPMVNDKWMEDDGLTFYMMVSAWMPYYNPKLFKVELW
jgi:hypothetical protein